MQVVRPCPPSHMPHRFSLCSYWQRRLYKRCVRSDVQLHSIIRAEAVPFDFRRQDGSPRKAHREAVPPPRRPDQSMDRSMPPKPAVMGSGWRCGNAIMLGCCSASAWRPRRFINSSVKEVPVIGRGIEAENRLATKPTLTISHTCGKPEKREIRSTPHFIAAGGRKDYP